MTKTISLRTPVPNPQLPPLFTPIFWFEDNEGNLVSHTNAPEGVPLYLVTPQTNIIIGGYSRVDGFAIAGEAPYWSFAKQRWLYYLIPDPEFAYPIGFQEFPKLA